MSIRQKLSVSALALLVACAVGSAHAQDVDRGASLRFVWQAAPAAYDPPFSKNQFQEMGYYLPIYDSLVRLDAQGNIVPSIATSWSFSADGRTLTMRLRPGMQFTDGSTVDAAAVVKSLTRTKKDPNSLIGGQLRSFEAFDAPDASTVVLRLNSPDANALYTLTTSVGAIVSAKALDSGVNLATTPVGSGPYKLVSSGPQGATYERNDAYYDKAQNQLAKLTILPIPDVTARFNALQTGQVDAGFFEIGQWPQVQQLVASGKFTVHRVLQPNSFPLWLNTKIKPFDDPRVRMAMNLAIDRDAINKGIGHGQCTSAGQPLQPGVVGHDEKLAAPKQDLAKAKQLLQEAGVGPFSFDAIVTIPEPGASIGVAVKAMLAQVGITMNIIPTQGPQTRPIFRQGKHGGMLMTLSSPAPDPATILDAIYFSPDNPGGVTPEFAKLAADARTKPIGSPEREAAYKALSKMAYEDPRQIFVCWAPVVVVARKGVVGMEKQPYLNAVPIPDLRSYGVLKSS